MKNLSTMLALGVLICATGWANADYSSHSDAELFAENMEQYDFSRREVLDYLSKASPSPKVLQLISRPAEKTLKWDKYRAIFVNQPMLDAGKEFALEHRDILASAQKRYGVPAYIILGIIGVETRFGRRMGDFNVLSALATLAFDYAPRGEFFKKELASYLQILRQEKINPNKFKGSYAGAFGIGQFMPSSYLAYAVDFDNDGVRDLLNSPADAIGSVANYLALNGWEDKKQVAVPAVLISESNQLRPVHVVRQLSWMGLVPEQSVSPNAQGRAIVLEGNERVEYWIGLHNFFVITRYNRSEKYAMAVFQLGQQLASELSRAANNDAPSP